MIRREEQRNNQVNISLVKTSVQKTGNEFEDETVTL